MGKRIVNGKIVDDADGPAGAGGRPAANHGNDIMAQIKHNYTLPYLGSPVPGYALLGVIALVSFTFGAIAGLLVAGALYYAVFVLPNQNANAAPPGRPGNSFNSWGGASVSQTQARGTNTPPSADGDRMKRAREKKFATMNDL